MHPSSLHTITNILQSNASLNPFAQAILSDHLEAFVASSRADKSIPSSELHNADLKTKDNACL